MVPAEPQNTPPVAEAALGVNTPPSAALTVTPSPETALVGWSAVDGNGIGVTSRVEPSWPSVPTTAAAVPSVMICSTPWVYAAFPLVGLGMYPSGPTRASGMPRASRMMTPCQVLASPNDRLDRRVANPPLASWMVGST